MSANPPSQRLSQLLGRLIFCFAVQASVCALPLLQALLTYLAALVGTVEELAASQQTLNLVRDQFEVNYFGPLNIIKAALPHMRGQRSGHIMILSGISEFTDRNRPRLTMAAAHIGTPGLGMYSAAGWALEGFCDVCICIRIDGANDLRASHTKSPRSTSNSPFSNAVSKSAFSPT